MVTGAAITMAVTGLVTFLAIKKEAKIATSILLLVAAISLFTAFPIIAEKLAKIGGEPTYGWAVAGLAFLGLIAYAVAKIPLGVVIACAIFVTAGMFYAAPAAGSAFTAFGENAKEAVTAVYDGLTK